MSETTTGAGQARRADRPGTMGRRRFLRVAAPGIGAVLLGASGLAAVEDLFGIRTYFSWYFRGARNYLASYAYAYLPPAERIKRHFDYLAIDEGGLGRFVRDYEKAYGRVTPRATAANRLLYDKFLMSTDFFVNGADASRVVRYVALHDPYITPCWNPLAPATARGTASASGAGSA